jgi:hypothetical protein
MHNLNEKTNQSSSALSQFAERNIMKAFTAGLCDKMRILRDKNKKYNNIKQQSTGGIFFYHLYEEKQSS